MRLTGRLVCVTKDEVALVLKHLPEHVALTRAEPGCLSFEVVRIGDSMSWRVEELFDSEASFAAHQQSVASSEWGRQTAAIARNYQVDRLT